MGRGRNRRRVDRESVAGGAPGRRRRLALALAGVALLAGAGAGAVRGWAALRSAESLRIRAIRFQGLSHATADELLALSPVRPGDHVIFADLRAMRAALERHPWVRALSVRRSWPPSLVVTVRERTAVALVDLGGLYLVDDEGNVFKRATAGDGLDLPVVTGIARGDYVQRRGAVTPLLKGALALVRAWRDGGHDARAPLAEIHLDPGDGTTLYVGDQGPQVRLGAGDLAAKLARLDRILSLLRSEGRTADVLHLDNRVHPSWVTVRLASSQPQEEKGRGPMAAAAMSKR